MQVVSMFAIGGCWRRADPDENSNEELRRDAESSALRREPVKWPPTAIRGADQQCFNCADFLRWLGT